MLDTVGLTCAVETRVDPMGLEARGWTVHTVSNAKDGVSVWASLHCRAAGDARLRYFANAGQLALEVSLPKLVMGDNASLLSWPACAAGLVRSGELAGDVLGAVLPPIESWQVFRLDPVWAWACDPGPYLAALHLGRLRGSQVAQEAGSVRWRSLRSGSIFARLYDKSQEQGHAVGLPTRFERQLRPGKQVIKVDGERIGRTVGDLNESDLLTILKDGAAQVGLSEPVRGVSAARSVLVSELGRRAGVNLFRVLLEARELGGFASDIAPDTRRKYEGQLKRAGVGMLSLDDAELPGLQVGA